MTPLAWLGLLMVLAGTASAQSLARDEVVEALKAGRGAEQLAGEAKQRGVGFYPNAEDEAALQAAGATPALLEALRSGYRPAGPPVSQDDIILLLKLRPPRQRLERLIESRGVDFDITPQTGAGILAAGGDSALVGLIALSRRQPPEPPPPPVPPLPPNPVPFTRISPYDAAAPAGVCDLSLHVDHEVELLVRGETIAYDIRRGAPPKLAGSSCNQPFPAGVSRIEVKKQRGRGKVTLLDRPTPGNHGTARILIEDSAGGSDLYHIRITWTR
jgi:hypothetical protein